MVNESTLPHVTVHVDAAASVGALKRIWRSIGYDEINWTYTTRGKEVFRAINELNDGPAWIRTHNAFTSGSEVGRDFWGATNCYTEDAAGNPVYTWRVVDRVYDQYLAHGCKPMVELTFMPEVLSGVRGPEGPFNPPRDYGKWRDLNIAFARHLVDRYGFDEVRSWYFTLWNECDSLTYFRGNPLPQIREEEIFKTIDFAVDALKQVDSGLRVGAPDLAWDFAFLRRFLVHCERGQNWATGKRGTPIDYVSLHFKATGYRRALGAVPPADYDGYTRRHLVTLKHTIQDLPRMRTLPILCSEWDIDVGTACSAYEVPAFNYRNDAYYPVFLIRGIKGILDTMARENLCVELVTQWAFYFENKRCFEGNRALVDQCGIRKPVFNALEMLARLGSERLSAATDDASADVAPGQEVGWFLSRRPRDQEDASMIEPSDRVEPHPQVDVLAARRGPSVQVLVWNQAADFQARGQRAVTVRIENLLEAAYRIQHYRIDQRHSNAYRHWLNEGAPDHPDPDVVARVRAHERLERLGTDCEVSPDRGSLSINTVLPMHSVSLFLLDPV